MADVAALLPNYLNLATTWYKNAVTRNTAQATLKNHHRNWINYQAFIASSVGTIFHLVELTEDDLYLELEPRQFELAHQAIWVLKQNESLRRWLHDAGFRPRRLAEEYLVRHHWSAPAEYYPLRRQRNGKELRLPVFGVTEKETAFNSLFDQLKAALDKFRDKMWDYEGEPPKPMEPPDRMLDGSPPGGPRLRGGYNPDDQGDGYAGTRSYAPDSRRDRLRTTMMPTRQQRIALGQAIQDLSMQLEEGVADMALQTGARPGQRQQQRARDHARKLRERVLREESRIQDAEMTARIKEENRVVKDYLEEVRQERRKVESVNLEDSDSLENVQAHPSPKSRRPLSHIFDPDHQAPEHGARTTRRSPVHRRSDHGHSMRPPVRPPLPLTDSESNDSEVERAGTRSFVEADIGTHRRRARAPTDRRGHDESTPRSPPRRRRTDSPRHYAREATWETEDIHVTATDRRDHREEIRRSRPGRRRTDSPRHYAEETTRETEEIYVSSHDVPRRRTDPAQHRDDRRERRSTTILRNTSIPMPRLFAIP